MNDPILSNNTDISHSAALICSHCASGHLPIRVARRDPPVHEVDTGWQFHCDEHDHTEDTPQVWAIIEIVDLDPSLRDILDKPPKTSLRRETKEAPWTDEPYEPT